LSARDMVRIAAIAAVYVVVTMVFAPFSYHIVQVRISEALTVLPYLSRMAVPGLFIGCLLANFFGGLGLHDIVFGSLATLVAGYLTARMPRPYLAPLPPVLVNALVVGWYLSLLMNQPFLVVASYVGLGQLVACYGIGYPLLLFLQARPFFRHLLSDRERV